MVRSIWKGYNTNSIKKEKIVNRNSIILVQHVGQMFKVHSGQAYVELLIDDGMVGKYFGDFVMTRRMGVDIHIKKRKKNK